MKPALSVLLLLLVLLLPVRGLPTPARAGSIPPVSARVVPT